MVMPNKKLLQGAPRAPAPLAPAPRQPVEEDAPEGRSSLRIDVQLPADYEQAAEYSRYVSHLNVKSAASLFFPPGGQVLDVGCGPGLLAEELADQGFKMLLVDSNEGFLHAAMARCPGAPGVLGNVLYNDLQPAENVVCIDVMQEFTPEQACSVLGKLPGKRAIVTFALREDFDTFPRSQYLATYSGSLGSEQAKFGLGGSTVYVELISRNMALRGIKKAGYTIRAEFSYYDYMARRIFLLERP